jgi:hypothetical protein
VAAPWLAPDDSAGFGPLVALYAFAAEDGLDRRAGPAHAGGSRLGVLAELGGHDHGAATASAMPAHGGVDGRGDVGAGGRDRHGQVAGEQGLRTSGERCV